MTDLRNWFAPKRVGWGWRPATREGWLVTLIGAILLIALFRLVSA